MPELTRATAFPDSESHYECECCGRMSRTIWGTVRDPFGEVVVYSCQWTIGGPEHPANVDLIMGPWDDESTPEDRVLISLLFRRREASGDFMVIDAEERQTNMAGVSGEGLTRREVMGTEFAQMAFNVVDAIWMDDPRIADLQACR